MRIAMMWERTKIEQMPFRIGGWTMLDRYGQSGTKRIFPAGVRSGPMQDRFYGSGAAGDRFSRESQLEPI